MEDLYCLEQTMVDVLRMSKLTIAAADSLTGGMISSTIAYIEGASDVFRGGFITHDLDNYAVGMHNCLSIPFDDLLANGFNTRQTDVRPAQSVNTAIKLK